MKTPIQELIETLELSKWHGSYTMKIDAVIQLAKQIQYKER